MFDTWKFIDWLDIYEKSNKNHHEDYKRNKKICLDRISGREYKYIAEEWWITKNRCNDIFKHYLEKFSQSRFCSPKATIESVLYTKDV